VFWPDGEITTDPIGNAHVTPIFPTTPLPSPTKETAQPE
jgi:hypothetical protein